MKTVWKVKGIVETHVSDPRASSPDVWVLTVTSLLLRCPWPCKYRLKVGKDPSSSDIPPRCPCGSLFTNRFHSPASEVEGERSETFPLDHRLAPQQAGWGRILKERGEGELNGEGAGVKRPPLRKLEAGSGGRREGTLRLPR